MAMFTKVNGKPTSSMAKVHSEWLMEEFIQETGLQAKCMAEDSTFGLKDNNMKVLTKTT